MMIMVIIITFVVIRVAVAVAVVRLGGELGGYSMLVTPRAAGHQRHVQEIARAIQHVRAGQL